MKYAKFERIVILVIFIAVLVMAVAMAIQKTDAVEIAGHLLMLAVIVSSLYFGKRGALLSFILCFGGYTAARLIWIGDFSYATAAQLVAAKFLVYGVLAMLCVYMRTQFRYFFVKLEHQDFIDDETQIGNERFLLKELASRVSENERYEIPFSYIDFTLDDDFVEATNKSRGVSVLRDISTSILKNDTRSVDELARTGNKLVVILPSVGRDGATVCGKRLESKILKYLEHHRENGGDRQVLRLEIHEYPEDREEVESFIKELRSGLEGR